MINKTTSAGRVIAKIYRDLNIKNPDWEEDAIEWIGEALGHIGVGPQIDKKTSYLGVENHTVSLPLDFFRLVEVMYYPNKEWTKDAQGEFVYPDLSQVGPVPLPTSDSTASPAIMQGKKYDFPDSYTLNGSTIQASFDKGIIHLVYYGIETDEMGYPLVPDDSSFMDAFLWYIIKQMMIGGWRHPNPEIGFQLAENRWLKYCRQARSKAKMPSLPKYDELVRNWRRVVETRDRRMGHFTSDVPLETDRRYGNERFS